MYQRVLKIVSSKWRMILLVIITALFPLYTMNKYIDNNAINHQYHKANIDVLYSEAMSLKGDPLLKTYSTNDQKQLSGLFENIIALHEAYGVADYDEAAILYNQVKVSLDQFQNDAELRSFIMNGFSIYSLPELKINPAFNVWPIDGKTPSSAHLFGVVGALDYFYYFMTHNTYLVWILVIVFMFDRFYGLVRHDETKDHLKASFMKAWSEFSLSYVLGLGLFLGVSIIAYGLGNVDRMISYFDQWLNYSVHMPYLYLSVAQLLFHLLIFGVMLGLILLFTVITHNRAYTLALICVTSFILFMLVTSNIASLNPLTYSDLLSNIHVGTTSHFLDANNMTLIKDTGSLVKGLIVTLVPIYGLLNISMTILDKQQHQSTVYKPLSD
ncbi:MAG: hypothetical protein PHP11_06550 [Erysipelotrichaceae bacterium]|nr:hypothetical protein [Erysipelotrichaceae bacterium]